MSDEPTYEAGDRVAVLRMDDETGEIEIIEAIVVTVIERRQAILRFPSGETFGYPVSVLTRMPEGGAGG